MFNATNTLDKKAISIGGSNNAMVWGAPSNQRPMGESGWSPQCCDNFTTFLENKHF